MPLKFLKSSIRKAFQIFGYDCIKTKFPPGKRMGIDPFTDMAYFLEGNQTPVICDVGANEGQTVDKFKKLFPASIIHSFEPSKETFQCLKSNIKKFDSVTAWNFGLGAEAQTLQFNENTLSSMSSFLPSTPETWGLVKQVNSVEVQTLDQFAANNKLPCIDVLKIDTQGYEYEVLKGSINLLKDRKIKLVYLEVTMGFMYQHLPPLSLILSFLESKNFSVVSFYDQHHEYPKGTLHWCDILFVNEEAAIKL